MHSKACDTALMAQWPRRVTRREANARTLHAAMPTIRMTSRTSLIGRFSRAWPLDGEAATDFRRSALNVLLKGAPVIIGNGSECNRTTDGGHPDNPGVHPNAPFGQL